MEFKIWQLLALSVLTGLLLGFSFPFTGGLFPLAFVALVPLLLVNYSLNQKKIKGRILIRFFCNYLAFVVFNTITTWWIYYASEGGVYMAILANSLLMTLPFGFAAFIWRELGENRGLLAFLVLWLGFEHVHYSWELSWPWLNFGHILGEQPMLIQWYEYGGVSGGSLWIVLINIVVYMLVRNVFFKKETWRVQTPILLFFIAAIIVPICSSLFIYYRYEEKVDPVDVVIVQPNIEANTEKFVLPVDFQLTKMFTAVEKTITPETDLIVCPETAIPYPKDENGLDDHGAILMVKQFLQEHYGVPMMIGADTYGLFDEWNSIASRELGDQWYENYNTALMIYPDMPLEKYHKSKLVLGAEKLPFVGMFPFLAKYSVELGGTASLLGSGDEPMLFEAKGVQYAPLICYESVYGDYASMFVRKGAQVICVITNDGWWRDTPGYKQHRMFSRIRAIENRRSVVRSANTGISCFIDQRGEIISELGWNEYGTLHEKINKNEAFTFFAQYGNVIGRISCFLSLAMMLYAFVSKAKKTPLYEKIKR